MNPNTPCMVQKGIFGVCATPTTDQQYMDFIETLFNTIGQTFIIEEKNMDGISFLFSSLFLAFAALTGCGPAYVYMFIDALADAGVRVGLPRNLAISLAAGTVEGSAEMVQQSGLHPGIFHRVPTISRCPKGPGVFSWRIHNCRRCCA